MDKKWLDEMPKPPYFCPSDPFKNYQAVSPSVQAAMILEVSLVLHLKEGRWYVPSSSGVVLSSMEMLNDLGIQSDGKRI